MVMAIHMVMDMDTMMKKLRRKNKFIFYLDLTFINLLNNNAVSQRGF